MKPKPKKAHRLLMSCVVIAALLVACTGTDDAIEVENHVRVGGIVTAEWVEESAVPAAAEVPDTPPALGPSSTPQLIHTEPDAVFLVVWGNNCRPEITVGGAPLQSPSHSEYLVNVDVTWDEADTCRGAINEWFVRAEVDENVDTSVTQVAVSLDRHNSDT